MKLFPLNHIAAAAKTNHADTIRAVTHLGIKPTQEYETDKRLYRLYDKAALDSVVNYFDTKRAARKEATEKPAPAAPAAPAAPQIDTVELHAKLDEILRHVKRLADELTTVEAQA